MKILTSLQGHEIYWDEEFRVWHYSDDNTLVPDNPQRPCVKCDKLPTKDSHDFCIQNLPGVVNACCGHGVEDGYIIFENGIDIRGKFKITKSK